MLMALVILLIIAMVVWLIVIAMNIRECMKQDDPKPQEQHVKLIVELKGKGWNNNDSN